MVITALHHASTKDRLAGLGSITKGPMLQFCALGVKPRNYLSLVRAYMQALVNHFGVTNLDEALASPCALAAYALYKAGFDPDGCPPSHRRWNANSACENLSTIPTALRYMGLPAPRKGGIDTTRIGKGIIRLLPETGIVSRPAISADEIADTEDALVRKGGLHNRRAATLLVFMTFTMMRASEYTRIHSRSPVTLKSGSVVVSIHDKTHVKNYRKLVFAPRVVPGSRLSSHAAFTHVHQLASKGLLHTLFTEGVFRTARGMLREVTRHTMGSIRPSGVLVHMRLGTRISVLKYIGGWSQTSNIWMDHYFDVNAVTE